MVDFYFIFKNSNSQAVTGDALKGTEIARGGGLGGWGNYA